MFWVLGFLSIVVENYFRRLVGFYDKGEDVFFLVDLVLWSYDFVVYKFNFLVRKRGNGLFIFLFRVFFEFAEVRGRGESF